MTPHERAIVRDFPERLTSERLEFRAPTPHDGQFINPVVRESIEHLSPWMAWAKKSPTLEESTLYARKALLEWHDRESLDYRLFFEGQFIGNCAIHTINWDVPKAQLGYWLHSGFHGQGFVSEAVETLTKLAFEELGLVRLEIWCNAKNLASAKVAKRAGFEHEAHLRNYFRGNSGELNDTLIFAKTNSPNSNG